VNLTTVGYGTAALHALREFRPSLGSDRLRALIGEFLPFLLFPTVSTVFPASADRPVLLLNTDLAWAAEQYFLRVAGASAEDCRFGAVESGARQGEDAVGELRSACLRALHGVFDLPLSGRYSGLDSAAADPACPDVLMVGTRGYELSEVAQVVNELHSRFHWLVIILLTGDRLPSAPEVSASGLPQAVLAEPPLDDQFDLLTSQFRTKVEKLC
jgi:hypothetical protein